MDKGFKKMSKGFNIKESNYDYRFRLKTLLFKKERHMLYFFAKVPIVEYKRKDKLFSFWKEFKRLTESVKSHTMQEMTILTAWAHNRFDNHKLELKLDIG